MKIYEPASLIKFAAAVLESAGLPEEPSLVVAQGLVDADLYGHTTHGLALLGDYVEEIVNGTMETQGEPAIIGKFGVVESWDGRRLPGIFTTKLAVEAAEGHAIKSGIGAIAIRRSHHIACLASFLEEPARRNMMVLIFSSDPGAAHVAPFGGTRPVLTPNPIAAGIPASREPVMIDISTSVTTAGMCARLRKEESKLPHPWALTADGIPSNDPNVLLEGGSILPVGGLDHGHKGFALSLLVESLTQGLSGFGRAERPSEWGASVFVLALSPAAFGPLADFKREVDWTLMACRETPVAAGRESIRIPGERALARKAEALKNGLTLHPSVEAKVQEVAKIREINAPRAIVD